MSLPHCPKCNSEYTYEDNGMFICPECAHEWNDAEPAQDADALIVKDANGNLLADGDSVTVVKDLKVKGSSSMLKIGTKVKNIREVKIMPLSPYISFAGNCAEATAFYQQAVGAELLYKITFGEMPKSDNSEEGCPSGMQFPDSAIAHSNVRIAGSDIMMSDGMPPGSNAQYAGFTLVLDTQDVNEGKRWFDNLAAGGNIDMAWQETFWAHGFGKVTDKYGVPWMINVVKQQTS